MAIVMGNQTIDGEDFREPITFMIRACIIMDLEDDNKVCQDHENVIRLDKISQLLEVQQYSVLEGLTLRGNTIVEKDDRYYRREVREEQALKRFKKED